MANRPLIQGEVKDKRQKHWENMTFMGMVAAMLQQSSWARRGLRAAPSLRFAGLPLKFKEPEPRSEAEKASKRAKRQARRTRIMRRGWA